MTDVLKMSRKALTMGVVLTTILWSMMATVLVAPMKAEAAGCTSGSLIKGSLAAVYYCGADMKRYVFTNDKAYMTWYSDFSGVTKISDADLASIQIGGNATYRPGVKMIKIQTDPKVYAIAHGGVLRPIASEAVATALYGSTWNKQIDDISDAFFTNYSVGSAISAAADYDKNAEMSGSQSVNADKGLSTSTVSGSLSVSLASDNAASATIPKGAMGVNMLKFNLRNGGASSATVDTVTIHRAGPGSTSDVSNVYLYEGSTRLTTARSVNSSTGDANFTGLNLALAAGQTRTLWVAVDFSTSATAGNVHSMQLVHALSGTVEAAGQPLMGNNFTLAGTAAGTLTIAKTGSITNPKLGEMGAKVAEFTVAAGSTEDVTLKRLTLYQGGNLAAANLTNLKLKQAGLTLATASGFDSNLHATFEMAAGFSLSKGQTKTFQVYADIGGSARSADTLKLYVEADADLYGVGASFGYGTSVTRTAYDGDSCTSSSGDCSYSSVEAGQVTVGFSGPSSKNVAISGKDVELYHFTIVAQSNVEVRNLRTNIAASASAAGASGLLTTSNAANVTDIKIANVATGVVWWGPKDVTGTDGTAADNDLEQDLVYTDVWTLQAGQTYEFKVTADVASTATADETLTFAILAFGTSDLRNLDNNTFLTPSTDVVPTGTITGNPMTLKATSLTASLSSTPVSQSYVKGSTNLDFVGMNLAAGGANPVTITEIDTIGMIDENASAAPVTVGVDNSVNVSDVILTCRLMDGATQIGSSKSPAVTTGAMNFTGINVTVAAGATKTLKVNCDISNSAYKNSNNEAVGFKISGITAQDPDGTNVDETGTPVNGATASTYVTITNTGSMSYALAPDDSESEAGIVIGGMSNVVLGKLRLSALSEELKQTKLRVRLLASNEASVVSMSLYDGATLVAGPVAMSGTNTDFSGMNFVVPKNGSKTLTVKAQINQLSLGATSGADLKIAFDTGYDVGQSNFEYRGTSSSTVVTSQAGADISANSKIVRATKPTVSLAPLPTSTLSNGTQVISRFTVTADSATQVSLKSIAFELNENNVSGTDLAFSSPAIREVGQGSDISASHTLAFCSTPTTRTCTFSVTFSSEQSVSAGTFKTYELRMTVAGADGSGESVSSKLLGDTALVTGELGNNANGWIDDLDSSGADAAYNFVWSDNSAIPHGDTADNGSSGDSTASGVSNDWTNGLYVKVVPSDTQTMSRS